MIFEFFFRPQKPAAVRKDGLASTSAVSGPVSQNQRLGIKLFSPPFWLASGDDPDQIPLSRSFFPRDRWFPRPVALDQTTNCRDGILNFYTVAPGPSTGLPFLPATVGEIAKQADDQADHERGPPRV